jgi:hypothetical protein
MRLRLTGTAALVALAASLVLAGSASALVGIYRNGMETDGQRGEIRKLSGERCGRGGSDTAFKITVGKRTEECSYRTPVLGRDVEVAATMRLLDGTPKKVRNSSYLALSLRAGAGAHYQLIVFPLQRKAQLVKSLPDGQAKFLRIARKVRTIKGVNRANPMRLRAFNVTSGPEKGSCKIHAYVGSELVAEFTDDAAGDLQGRATGFAVGATKNAKGAVGSADDVVVRVPNPF